MKLIFSLLAIGICLCNSNEFGKDRVGVSSSTGQSDLAIAYSVAETKVDNYYSRNAADFKSPQIVSSLPRRTNLNTGEQYAPEVVEKNNSNDYYDGSRKLHLK